MAKCLLCDLTAASDGSGDEVLYLGAEPLCGHPQRLALDGAHPNICIRANVGVRAQHETPCCDSRLDWELSKDGEAIWIGALGSYEHHRRQALQQAPVLHGGLRGKQLQSDHL